MKAPSLGIQGNIYNFKSITYEQDSLDSISESSSNEDQVQLNIQRSELEPEAEPEAQPEVTMLYS